LRASLARSGLLERIGEQRLFASADEAVRSLCQPPGSPPWDQHERAPRRTGSV
jgi:hypothetical protein